MSEDKKKKDNDLVPLTLGFKDYMKQMKEKYEKRAAESLEAQARESAKEVEIGKED